MNEEIRNSAGERLDYQFIPGKEELRKKGVIVVLGHGVTGNRERPVIQDTAKALSVAGYDTLAFSFAGNGDSEGDFRASTISKETGDLRSVLDVVCQQYEHVIYVGHSMGGAVGVLVAANDSRINGLISLAGMIDTKTFAETEFGEETPDEGLMWEEEDCPLSLVFMKDLCETIRTVEPQIAKILVPWLLLHGTKDDVVLPQDTEKVVELRSDQVQAVFIEGADHSFNEPDHKKEMMENVVQWVGRQV